MESAPTAENSVKVTRLHPTWSHELELCALGHTVLAGVDEAGRGAWAGPLVAAAVVLPHRDALGQTTEPDAHNFASDLALLRDSKLLTPNMRDKLLGSIQAVALAVGVGTVSSALLDVIGVGPANR